MHRVTPDRARYVAVNLAKNALAPAVVRLRPGRRVLGMDGDGAAIGRTLQRFAEPLRSTGRTLDGATVLELGPGRTPEICAAAVLAGARSADGVDVRVYVDDDPAAAARYVGLQDLVCGPDAADFLDAAGSTAGAVRARADSLGPRLPVSLRAFDGAALPFADASVDVVLSKSVLEHVPTASVPALLGELHRVLRPGGAMVHVIDLRDHLHIAGDDAVVGDWLEALRYPAGLFDRMFSNRATSINRLRAGQWLGLLAGAGFEVTHELRESFALDPSFDRTALQAPWSGLELDELSVGILTVGATRA